MPPKAQSTAVRGRGRPKATAVPETPAVVEASKKRGRPAKADATDTLTQPAKKRGRPSKSEAKATVAPAVSAASGRGRRSLAAPASPAADATATSSKNCGSGQPRKEQPAAEEAPVTPKRRGRPARTEPAVDIKRVANVGSPRVAKRSSPRAKRTIQAATQAPRLNPLMRSRLRTRQPAAEKTKRSEAIPQPPKRRGRPAKAVLIAPTVKKASGFKAAKSAKASQPALPTKAASVKPVAPRKRRGYTSIEIPDRFLVQVEQFLQDIQEAERLPTPAEDDAEVGVDSEAEEEEDHIDIDVEIGEDIVITSAAPADEGEEARLITGEEDIEVDEAEEDVEVDEAEEESAVSQEEEIIEPELALDTVISKDDIAEAVTHLPTEVDVALSVQEEVHVAQTSGDVEAIVQEVREEVVINREQPAPGLSSEEADDMLAAIIAESEAQPATGVIFG